MSRLDPQLVNRGVRSLFAEKGGISNDRNLNYSSADCSQVCGIYEGLEDATLSAVLVITEFVNKKFKKEREELLDRKS